MRLTNAKIRSRHCFTVQHAAGHSLLAESWDLWTGNSSAYSAIASSSLATEWLKGKTLTEATEIKNTDIVKELNLPPVKIHCSVLAEDAIKAAIENYKSKESASI